MDWILWNYEQKKHQFVIIFQKFYYASDSMVCKNGLSIVWRAKNAN